MTVLHRFYCIAVSMYISSCSIKLHKPFFRMSLDKWYIFIWYNFQAWYHGYRDRIFKTNFVCPMIVKIGHNMLSYIRTRCNFQFKTFVCCIHVKMGKMYLLQTTVFPYSDRKTCNLLKCSIASWKALVYMSHHMRFPTMWYVQPAKPQISPRIRPVWSEPLLVAWIFYEC